MRRRMRPARGILSVAVLPLLVSFAAGCGGSDDDDRKRKRDLIGKAQLELEPVGEAKEPVFLSQPPGEQDDLYVVERAGTIRVLDADGELARDPFLDIRSRVHTDGEGGLLSLAFAPDYAESGHLYVAYAGRDKRLHLEEFTRASGAEPAADPASRRSLLEIEHPNDIHWGGLATFGPDGYLYLATGDGGPLDPISDVAQDLDSLLGKLLRIDPRSGEGTPYLIPRDNPYVGRPGRDEVYAYGFRNPWRYSFDRKTDAFSFGDVGSSVQEELNYVESDKLAGANFGWPAFEGTASQLEDVEAPGAIPPAYSYERTGEKLGELDPTCAVTGGYVVRDSELPELEGRYVYADFCQALLRSFEPGAEATDERSLGVVFERIASFAEDNAGHIYALSLNGEIVRLSLRAY